MNLKNRILLMLVATCFLAVYFIFRHRAVMDAATSDASLPAPEAIEQDTPAGK